jgi:hypothetical protein
MRNRASRAQVYGFLAMPLVLALLSAARPSAVLSPTFLVYMVGFAGGAIVGLLPYHEHHAAGWIYGALPIRAYGQFVMGMVRALIVRHLMFPLAFVVGVHLAAGASATDVLGDLHGFAVGLLSIPTALSFAEHVPFGRAAALGSTTRGIGIFLLEMLALGVFGVFHWRLAETWPIGFAITVPIVFAGWAFWLRRIRRSLDRRVPDDLLPEGWPPPRGAPAA